MRENILNGLLVIDKPGGITSHDVVYKLRRITGEKSIGHLGTLDPMATGVLPLMLGKFTRLAQYFSSAEKSYYGSIRFGFATDTWDAEGQPAGPDLCTQPSLEAVRDAASRFHGDMDQMPPPFSAKKIAGTPAYKLAREGKSVELKTAKVHIASFHIDAVEGSTATFTMSISAGGYVRSIAHEIGQALGCGAHLTALRRTQAGPFSLAHAHTLADCEALAGNAPALDQLCVHPRTLLPEMPSVTADAHTLGRLRNGAQANLPEFSQASLVKVFADQRDLVAIAKRIAGTLFQPVTVMG
jgi:tRNA pseudouridine55 synthase